MSARNLEISVDPRQNKSYHTGRMSNMWSSAAAPNALMLMSFVPLCLCPELLGL